MYKSPGHYEYKKNNYRSRPTKDQPEEIFNYNWARIKRDIVLGVLKHDLPLSAIEETEHAEEFAAEYTQMIAGIEGQSEFEPVEPVPTDAAAYSAGATQMDEVETDWRASGSRGYMPAQTGVPDPDMGDGHTMRRQKEHLAAHRHGHH